MSQESSLHLFLLLCFEVHYAPGPSNTLFGSMRGMDRSIHFQFEGQASLFSEDSTPERNALILGGGERTLRIIMSTVVFEWENCTILGKPDFLFEDVAPDTDQQLLVREGQWVYTLNGTTITSREQTSLSPDLLSVSDYSAIDYLLGELDHRISACGDFDQPWVQ